MTRTTRGRSTPRPLIRRRRGVPVAAFLAALLVATLGACADSEDGEDSGADDVVRLGFFAGGGLNGYTQAQLEGMKEAAEEMGATVEVLSGNFDPTMQVQQLQTALAQDSFDSFIVFPTAAEQVVPQIEQAGSEGIPVVCITSQCGTEINSAEAVVEGQTSFVGFTPERMGTLLAEQALAACADLDPCKVAWLGGIAVNSADILLLKTFEEAVEGSSIDIVSTQYGQFDRQASLGVAQNVLTSNPDLDVYVAQTDQMALGVEQAVSESDGHSEVRVIGAGAGKGGYDAVKQGTMFATVATLPRTEGRIAAEIAIRAARGEKVEAGIDSLDLSEVGTVITADNVDEFTTEWTD